MCDGHSLKITLCIHLCVHLYSLWKEYREEAQQSVIQSLVFLHCLCYSLVISFFKSFIKSNQFYLYSSKSQSHFLNGLYNLYSEWHPLSLDPWFEWGTTCHVDGEKKTMEETSERATEEGSLFQEGQTSSRCHVYRKDQQIRVQDTLTECLIQKWG